MIKTNVELTREDYSKAIRALADQGLTNEKIATMLNISRKKVGGVMAWKNNRSSWEK
jgi:orotate phosphoribosyltransferase-like protein